MTKVFVTGASGFIGHHLVKRLAEKNYDVHCLVRPTSNTDQLRTFGVRFHYGDTCEIESLWPVIDSPDFVFHLAARTRARSSHEFFVTNQGGTKNIAEVCLKQPKPPVFLYVSSLAAVGPTHPDKPKSEVDPLFPISSYGKSKFATEKMLASLSDRMPCTVVRPAIVYGEADTMILELFRTVQKLGVCPIPGWRDRIYSWIHAADLVELMILAAESGERLQPESLSNGSKVLGQGIYFGTADNGVKLSEVGRLIGQAVGRRRTIAMRCPPMVLFGIALYYEILKRATGKDQSFDWDKAYESCHHWICSAEKSKQQLKFSPSFSMEDRMTQTARWYFEQGWMERPFSCYEDVSPS